MRLVLEEKLQVSAGIGTFYRDIFCVLLLGALAAALPMWRGGLAITASWFMDEAVSFNLLVALGMLVAIRSGAVDLSVWASAAAGGLVAAAWMNAGWPLWAAVASALVCGAAIGAVSGLLTSGLGVPSVISTAGVGLAAIWTMQGLCEGRDVSLEGEAIESVIGVETVLKIQTPRLLVGGMFLAVLAVLAWGGSLGLRVFGPGHLRCRVFASLCASGLLAAGGGVVWLLSTHGTPVPHRLIDDLRVPVAVLLAGGLYLAGPGRLLLAVALLPGALLAATLWRQHWPMVEGGGYLLHVALLGVVGHLAYVAASRALRPGRWQRGAISLAAWFVICLMAISLHPATMSEPFVLRAFRVVAVAQCAAMVLIWAAALRGKIRPSEPGDLFSVGEDES